MATRSTPENVAQLQRMGIETIQLTLQPTLESSEFECLSGITMAVILLPPGVRKGCGSRFPEKIANLISGLKRLKVSRMIFTSSTSVYPSDNREVDETEVALPDTVSGRILLEAEKRIMEDRGTDGIIVRFAGLCGPGREPGRLLAGKAHLRGSNNPVNLIHQQDAVDLLVTLINHRPWGQIFNGCAPGHPIKSHLYLNAAKAMRLVPPEFTPASIPFKKVNGDKICRQLGFAYRYPDPIRWHWS